MLFEFSFQGDTAKVIDQRFTTAREVSGPLKIRSATGFGITDSDGTTYYYSVVFDGDEVFMGLGAAVEVEEGPTFSARIGAWERLIREEGEEGCRYVKTWGGSTSEESVACELKTKGDREIFTYQSEDPFRPGKLKTFELTVVGKYLLGKELAAAKAERFDPAKETAEKDESTKAPTKKELLVVLPDTAPEPKTQEAPAAQASPQPATAPATKTVTARPADKEEPTTKP
jgi:hypothetical protein